MNLKWALLVEGMAAQMYGRNGTALPWCAIREEVKRKWRAAAKGRLRRGVGPAVGGIRRTPKTVQ